ncbi:MAG TPA: response regulator [Caldimonas sp.]
MAASAGYLVAKVDLALLRDTPASDAALVLGAGALALVAAAGGLLRWRDRQVLRSSQAREADQAQRLRDLELLRSIATESTDVIFAQQDARPVRDAIPPDSRPAPSGDGYRSLQTTHAGALILLAEDNLINQEVAVELLRSAGLTVEVASNGTEAFAMAQARAYDLILMDVQMPEVDDLQATRALRATPGGRTVPIVAMTANAFGEDREACLAAGMNDHIAKPVHPDLLYATLLCWLPARTREPAVAAAPDHEPRAAIKESGSLRSRLAAIEGLDVVRGLKLFDGRMESYFRVLRTFASMYVIGMPEIDQALAADSPVQMAAAGHLLRGASGSIGATQLEALAGVLEGRGGALASPEAAAAAVALQALLIETAGKLRHVVEEEDEALAPGIAWR